MKLYVHVEQPFEFTKVVKIQEPDATVVSDVVDEFIAACNDKFGATHSLCAKRVRVLDAKQKPISLSTKVKKALKNQDDVYIVVDESINDVEEKLEHVSITDKPTTSQTSTAGASPSITEKTLDEHEAKQLQAILKPLIERADEAAKAQNYRAAAEVYEQVSMHNSKGHAIHAAQGHLAWGMAAIIKQNVHGMKL